MNPPIQVAFVIGLPLPGYAFPETKGGSIFEILYRRLVLRLGHNKTIGAIAHRLCLLIWIILHRGVRYEERGLCEKSKRLRTGAKAQSIAKRLKRRVHQEGGFGRPVPHFRPY